MGELDVSSREIPLSPHTVPEFRRIRRNYYCIFDCEKLKIDDEEMAGECSRRSEGEE